MIFSSIVFLCLFFPVVVIVYYLCPRNVRNLWLLLASLFFYAYGEPVYIFIMLFSTVFDYCNGRGIAYFQKKGKAESYGKALLVLSMVGNLALLGFFKYADFSIGTWNSLTGSSVKLLSVALPIGISFYTFQTMSYTIDVYRKQVKCQKNFIDFAMYVCLFPQLIAGPIVRYSHISEEIRERNTSLFMVAEGLQRFSVGLGKKVLLANQIGALYEEICGYTGNDRTAAIAWLGAIAYAFQIYFDFSGYSDMAIGLGKIFGFHFPENFAYPYESKSITEFWRRWHMTLGGWFREYVYIPLGGNRKGFLRQMVNMAIVWFLTGLWHGANWNFVLWGMYYFVLLMLEKAVCKLWNQKWGQKKFSKVGHGYAMIAVLFGWVIFSCEDMSVLADYIKTMLGVGVEIGNALALYQWSNYAVFLLVLAFGATSLPKRVVKKIVPDSAEHILMPLYSLFLLVLCVAFLIDGSYNPFLYFRF